MLMFNVNRKSYMWSPMATSHLTLTDLERSVYAALIFKGYIFHKGAYLGRMLLLNMNRKSQIGSQMAPLHWTFSELDSSNLGWQEICMVLVYLPAVYYNLNLAVARDSVLSGGIFHYHSGLSCTDVYPLLRYLIFETLAMRYIWLYNCTAIPLGLSR